MPPSSENNNHHHVNLVVHDVRLTAGSGAEISVNLRRGLAAVSQLFSNITRGPYFMPMYDVLNMPKVIRLPMHMTGNPPPKVLEILTTVAQRVFNAVANGDDEATVLAAAEEEVHREFMQIPGPSEQ